MGGSFGLTLTRSAALIPIPGLMPRRFRSMFSHRVRRFAALLCLGAVSVQLTLPVLHASHELGNLPLAALSSDPSPALQASAPAAHHGERHDPAACPVCRTTSQSKGIVPVAPARLLPLQLVSLIGLAEGNRPLAQACPGGLAARAPPLAA